MSLVEEQSNEQSEDPLILNNLQPTPVIYKGTPNDFMFEKKLKVILTVLPFELSNESMEKVIVSKLVNTLQNVCYDNVFIKQITHIEPVKNGKIGTKGEVNFLVEFNAKVLCPKENDLMTGYVQKIITAGVFVEYDALRCFIKRQSFTQQQWNNLRLNNVMTVILKTFRYHNYAKSLSCVGEPLFA